MLELYNFSQSTCSQKVRLVLAEKQMAWEDKRLISKNHDHLSDWYLKLNPNGVVPTLIDGGRPVIESSNIMQYLDAIHPQTPLMPADAYGQAEVRAWLTYVDLVSTPASRYPSFQYGGLRIKFQQMTEEAFQDKIALRPVKSAFYRKMSRAHGFPDEIMAEAFKDLRATVARMDKMLAANGGPWLMGGQLTIADMAVVPLVDRWEDVGLEDLWMERHPRVDDWLKAMQALPSFKQAFYPGCRLSEQYPELSLGRGANSHVVREMFPAEASAEAA
ncbi:MAG: glutathione S-transferase family protein [Rhodobiaceae bacterium]|nr:glutathione S-transferase family protein [Rhodobiaceae bacterium]